MTATLYNSLPFREQVHFIMNKTKGEFLGKVNELIFPAYTVFFQVALSNTDIVKTFARELPKKRKREIRQFLDKNGKTFIYAVHDNNKEVKQYFFDAIQRHTNLRN